MREYSNKGPKVKVLKCLRCDIPFKTTPERRLCQICVRRAEELKYSHYQEKTCFKDSFSGSVWDKKNFKQ